MKTQLQDNSIPSQDREKNVSEGSFTLPEYYTDIGGHEGHKVDGLGQLRNNIAVLEDLHGRMQFMMKEISSLLKKS